MQITLIPHFLYSHPHHFL